MKIYIAHSKKIPYERELYNPIINSSFYQDHTFIFPHLTTKESSNPREFYKTLDVMFAEVSSAGTGLGIELGWAFDDHIPIYCFYRKGSKISGSIKCITSNIFEYETESEMLQFMEEVLNIIKAKK